MFEAEFYQLGGDVFGQFRRGFLAGSGELFGDGFEFLARFREGGGEGFDFFGAVVDVVESLGDGGFAGNDVCDGGTVFAFQGFDGVDAFLDRGGF